MQRFEWEHTWSSGEKEVVAVYVCLASSPPIVEVLRARPGIDVPLNATAVEDVLDSLQDNLWEANEDDERSEWEWLMKEYGVSVKELLHVEYQLKGQPTRVMYVAMRPGDDMDRKALAMVATRLGVAVDEVTFSEVMGLSGELFLDESEDQFVLVEDDKALPG